MTDLFSAAQKLIAQSQKILISGHDDPDADSIASMLALKAALAKLGKEIEAVSKAPVPPRLRFLPGASLIKNSVDWRKSDLIIGVDYGDIKRLDIADFDPKSAIPFLTFDHHLPSNQKGLKIIRPDLSSTSELIFLFLKYLKIYSSPEISTCLLTGIFGDTNGFRHASTSPQTLETAAELLKKGVSLAKIVKNFNRNNPADEARFQVLATEKTRLDRESGLLTIFFSENDLKNFPDDFNKISVLNLLGSVPEAKTLLFLSEKNGELEGSLRSQKGNGVNVAELAQIFGGGGHALAAGFKTTEPPEIVIEKIQTALGNIQNYSKAE